MMGYEDSGNVSGGKEHFRCFLAIRKYNLKTGKAGIDGFTGQLYNENTVRLLCGGSCRIRKKGEVDSVNCRVRQSPL